MLHKMIVGEDEGQIMVNFDEFSAECQEGGDAEQIAKQWKHLYQPDYQLIFNQTVFPTQTLKGKEVGDFMIEKYQLFDFNQKPQNINLRSHTSINDPKNSIDASFKNGKSHILAQDGYEELNVVEQLNRSAQNTARDAPISGQMSHT